MGNYIELTDGSFKKDVLESPVPVLVDFWAEWCAPCRMIAPVIEQVAGEYAGKIKVGKMDVDANPDTPSQYGITGIPTMILFKNGSPVEKIVGAVAKNKIVEMVNNAL
ncbi:MAG: thioredoxin [Spirochaetes bacterium GWF1_51_8]|nr:MAG: thioredoxin [Spirochaetes bacterium GWF1_51_8]